MYLLLSVPFLSVVNGVFLIRLRTCYDTFSVVLSSHCPWLAVEVRALSPVLQQVQSQGKAQAQGKT